MYAPTYGLGQGGNNSAQQQQQQQLQQQQQQQQSAFSPNNVPPAAHPLPHYFPGQQPQQPQIQQQQQQQHPQQMMYNSQQYGASGAGGPGPQQNPYAGMGINPAMMQGNGGMAHMTVNNGVVQGYQTPYSSSPYNTGMPNPTGAMPMQQQQQFMTPTPNNAQFAMNAAAMTPQQQHLHQQQQQQQHQHQQQRMQAPQASTPIPNSQRVSPYGGASHNTPPQAQAQSQFITPQGSVSNQPHLVQTAIQTQNNNPPQTQQPQGQNTPQTPKFPPNLPGAGGQHNIMQTPMSPASENREKERVSLLLEINRELLREVMRLQALQAEAKKESVSNTPTPTDTKDGESKPLEKPSPAVTGKEFVECMRRLQANLAYLAAIADRSHKPSSQIPPHPAIISAPPLSPLHPKNQVKHSPNASATPKSNIKIESTTPSEAANGAGNGALDSLDDTSSEKAEDRLETIKILYSRLQSLFPGVDPKKEPSIQSTNKNMQQKGQAQRQNINPGQNQIVGQLQGAGTMAGGKPQQPPQGMMAGNITSQGP